MKEDLMFCKNITAGVKTKDLFGIFVIFLFENNLIRPICVGACAPLELLSDGWLLWRISDTRSKSPNIPWNYVIKS